MAETRGSKPLRRGHKSQRRAHKKAEKPPSWGALRSFFSCKHYQAAEWNKRNCMRIGCSMVFAPQTASPEVCKKWSSRSSCDTSSRSLKPPPDEIYAAVSSCSSFNSSASIPVSSASTSSCSSLGGSFRGLHLRGFAGCYECRFVVDPINGMPRDPYMRATICPCPDCGEIFMKRENLEHHQAVSHAVSELGPDDTSRKIVEIIFQSSWLRRQAPICKIDRILKIHNSKKTMASFEDYRDSIKSKANKLVKKHPRCIADGNELLRFHCTTFVCSLGLNGSTNLCHSIPRCNVCSIIRDGFKVDGLGKVCITATSGKAHDVAQIPSDEEKRAVLVCRVIAGRVKRSQDFLEECDSVAGPAGVYSNMDELFVFNPKAILPCFVVIYSGY